MKRSIKKLVGRALFVWSILVPASWAFAANTPSAPPVSVDAAFAANSKLPASTTDHSKLQALQGPFKTGPEVTKACLQCHNMAGHQVTESIRWKWEAINPLSGQRLGKQHIANNFCGSVLSNEPRCTSCHAGYNWKDKHYDFSNQDNVDCLACHDTTGTYKKIATDAGHPLYEPREMPKGSGKIVQPPDLAKIAQHVGKPGRKNCGACHFSGGGGDAVKHGDLDSSLINPARKLDVHMSPEGANMSCADCHTFNKHQVSGSRYTGKPNDPHGMDTPIGDDKNRATCQSCHGNAPHKKEVINNHNDRLACQTCHIPAFARGGIGTKTLWDWSTAGKRDEHGKPVFIKDDHGHLTYSAEKGDFKYGENVIPTYKWYNGIVKSVSITDKIDDSKILELNAVEGSAKDPNARIWPFKVMVGKQPYDSENKTLIVNHVYGKDDTSFWENFDYSKSIKAGMDYAGLPYSGKFGFIETRMNWFITHMVAPKEDAVKCAECHSRRPDNRLADIKDIYIPGRDYNPIVETLGWLAVAGSIAAAIFHGAIRYISRRRKDKDHG